jgi:hypothetical protein
MGFECATKTLSIDWSANWLSLQALSGADCLVSSIPYCIYQQWTPICVPFIELYFPAAFCIIFISAVGILLVTLSCLYV